MTILNALVLNAKTLWLRLRGAAPRSDELTEQAAQLSDAKIHGLSPEQLATLDPKHLQTWSVDQLGAVTPEQLRHLKGPQLAAYLQNPALSEKLLARLTTSFAQEPDCFAELLNQLGEDEDAEAKLLVICSTIENDLPLDRARDVLLQFARHASDAQFSMLLDNLPFSFVRSLSWLELDNPDPREHNDLAMRVEQRQIRNSAELMRMTQDLRALEQAFYSMIHGESVELDESRRPWRWISQARLQELQELLDEGLTVGQNIAIASDLMVEMRMEIIHHQAHLQMQNCRVPAILELWNREQMDYAASQAQILQRIILPQFSVVKQIAGILDRRGKANMNDEQRAALMGTAQQGLQLVEVMERELGKAEQCLTQLRIDRNFLQRALPVFLENIRYENRLGRFSLEFFLRVELLQGKNQEAFAILHGEDYEELLVEHEALTAGMKSLEALLRLNSRVEEIYHGLRSSIDELDLQPVADQIRDVLNAQA